MPFSKPLPVWRMDLTAGKRCAEIEGWGMAREQIIRTGWLPVQGSYEESVMSWQEQIELSFRRRVSPARQLSPDSGDRYLTQSPPVSVPGIGLALSMPAVAGQIE